MKQVSKELIYHPSGKALEVTLNSLNYKMVDPRFYAMLEAMRKLGILTQQDIWNVLPVNFMLGAEHV